MIYFKLGLVPLDTLAERLRRRPAKPTGSPRVGSNPTGVVFIPCATELLMSVRQLVFAIHDAATALRSAVAPRATHDAATAP